MAVSALGRYAHQGRIAGFFYLRQERRFLSDQKPRLFGVVIDVANCTKVFGFC